MAAENKKTTFTAAEVAELLRPLNQSIQALQEENAALKKKLEHMNEIFLNAQRARFGQSSEKKSYACDRCEKDTGFAHIVSVQAPAPLMKHSLASASSVADIMTKKYADGLPLARQEKIWAREGVELSRATMANWVIQCTQTWLKPLYKHMKQQLLRQSVIHADETVVQVLKEDNKPAVF